MNGWLMLMACGGAPAVVGAGEQAPLPDGRSAAPAELGSAESPGAIGPGPVATPALEPRVVTWTGTLVRSAGLWELVPCTRMPRELRGDLSEPLRGLGGGPWQVMLSATEQDGALFLVDVGYASPVGDVCQMRTPFARGTEPGWSASWSGSGGTFQSAGTDAVSAVSPTVTSGPCHDGSVGAYFHRSATIDVGGVHYVGCAVVLSPAQARE